jgi:predicted adenine nucleotide alpha hydrolase (AANH) superfamily ATPase
VKLIRPCPAGSRVLVHVCCAPDAAYGLPALRERYEAEGFFYNPNIHPGEEHARRIDAVRVLADRLALPVEAVSGGEEDWERAARGLEGEPEKGARCEACIRMRLARTAAEAKSLNIAAYCTVLTVSPRKDAALVNRVGREEGERAGVFFVEADMKKGDGFRRSVEVSKALGLYRQNYCGCRYSIRP